MHILYETMKKILESDLYIHHYLWREETGDVAVRAGDGGEGV